MVMTFSDLRMDAMVQGYSSIARWQSSSPWPASTSPNRYSKRSEMMAFETECSRAIAVQHCDDIFEIAE